MQLVIPLKNDGNYDQLRFALRSICTHHEITECILVGGKPKWYTGTHIPFPDYGLIKKEENIRDKTISGAELTTGEFMYSNDDFIPLAPITKTWNKGMLQDIVSKRGGNGSYTRLLRNTLAHYGNVPCVDAHCPMVMTKEGVQRTAFKWPLFGLGFKTCYSQENNIESVFMEDSKVSSVPAGREWFSLQDNFNLNLLLDMFPSKSKFEI